MWLIIPLAWTALYIWAVSDKDKQHFEDLPDWGVSAYTAGLLAIILARFLP